MTRITAEESREIETRSKQREARLRGKYPEVDGKDSLAASKSYTASNRGPRAVLRHRKPKPT